MTHGDQDHVGGLQAVLEQFPVHSLLMNGSLTDSKTVTKLMSTAITKDIQIYSVSRGMTLKPDEYTTFEFLFPLPAHGGQKKFPILKNRIMSRWYFGYKWREFHFYLLGIWMKQPSRRLWPWKKVIRAAVALCS